MSKKTFSSIGWTDYTYNHWRGCHKRSPGCKYCYAETLAKRNPAVLGIWGPDQPRVRASAMMQFSPFKWSHKGLVECRECALRFWDKDLENCPCPNPACKRHSEGAVRLVGLNRWKPVRPRVFTASMSDVGDEKVPDSWRDELFRITESTKELDWLVLTKEPQNLARYFAQAAEQHGKDCREMFEQDGPWENLWVGVSAENQETWNDRTAVLHRSIPAQVTFASCEPLLEEIDLSQGVVPSWIITGGESGSQARRCLESWQHDIAHRGKRAGAAIYQKQLGSGLGQPGDPKGEKPSSWQKAAGPTREWPESRLPVRLPSQFLEPKP